MTSSVPASIQVLITGNRVTRVSNKTGKPYTQAEGFATLPNVPYPQLFQFYCETEAQVPAPGIYEVALQISIRDNNLDFRCDPRQGRRVGDVPKAAVA